MFPSKQSYRNYEPGLHPAYLPDRATVPQEIAQAHSPALARKTQSLQSDPLQGEKLKGELHFLRSLHTRMKNSDYRIIYEIIPEKLDVIIHYLATRENFYKELTRLRLKSGN